MNLYQELKFRGLIYQISNDNLVDELNSEGFFTVYAGFDPTASSFHVGHLLQLCLLKRFAQLNHKIVVLIGGATGLIGDPSGKTTERPLLDEDTVARNVESLKCQIETLFGSDLEKISVVNNLDWWANLNVTSFFREVGKYVTVNQMLARESVKKRIENPDAGISFAEFSYMLLQAYDYLYLFDNYGVNLQVGASDQWGNIVQGIDLIRRIRNTESPRGLTTPLLTKSDGQKFGKSESGTVWLDANLTSPYELYQFFYKTEDTSVISYLKYFTFVSTDEITQLENEQKTNPKERLAQKTLAYEVCKMVHGQTIANEAKTSSESIFKESVEEMDIENLISKVPTKTLAFNQVIGISVEALALLAELTASKGEAKRLVSQGGLYLNNVRINDSKEIRQEDLIMDKYLILRAGKTKQLVVELLK